MNGYFDSQKHTTRDWTRLLGNAPYKYFDVVGEKAHLLFETADYRNYCGSAEAGISVINQFDTLVKDEQKLMGMVKYNRIPGNRALFHVMYHSYMYSTSYRTAYNHSTVSSFLTPNGLRTNPWGPAHELGHTHQVRPDIRWQGTTECTVNIPSLYIQTGWGNPSRIQNERLDGFNNRYEKAYERYFVRNIGHFDDDDVFCKLVPFWQIKLYVENVLGQNDFYKDLYELGRSEESPRTTAGQIMNFTYIVSKVSGQDFTEFFDSWGYYKVANKEIDDYGKSMVTVTNQDINNAKQKIAALGNPKPNAAIRYISDSNWQIFKNQSPVSKGTVKVNGKRVTFSGWQNAVAYEVRDSQGTLLFVSNFPSFDLRNEIVGGNAKYYGIQYDGQKIEVSP